jgi:hypothetical protein
MLDCSVGYEWGCDELVVKKSLIVVLLDRGRSLKKSQLVVVLSRKRRSHSSMKRFRGGTWLVYGKTEQRARTRDIYGVAGMR